MLLLYDLNVMNYISHIYLEIINTHSLTTAVPMTN